MSIEGVRVVRGPAWSLGDSDGGEGHVGTVTKVNAGHSVEVQWDMGEKTTCRTGKNDKCDLRILDSAPAGVRNNNFKCDARDCGENNFAGTRWHCSQCTDFDLCSPCYFKDRHNIQHTFFRFDAPGMNGERVPKRSTSQRLRSWGTFEEATVKRGPDWRYDKQDGGNGKPGSVVQIKKWSDSTGDRNGVTVCWTNNNLNHYRLGYNGKVDVLCEEATTGTDYYRDHLLPLNTSNIPKVTQRQTGIVSVDCETFKKGDKVCIQLPEVALKETQKGHGGWSVRMVEVIGQHGVVKKVEDNGDVVVTFDDKEWRLNSSSARKVPVVTVGDTVRILDNQDKVQAMQRQHGGWVSDMAPTLGKVGKVVKIDSDGDVAVAFGGTAFVYNAACCQPVPGNTKVDTIEKDRRSQTSGGGSQAGDNEDKDDDSEPLKRLMAQLFLLGATRAQATVGPKEFVSAAANNQSSIVKAMIQKQSSLVNVKVQGLTALIIASHEGHVDVVRVLMQGSADMDATDDKGNTALMAALMKKREDVAIILLDAGANITIVNQNNMNALHHAALNGANNSLQQLVKRNCDVNQKDSDGDTPIHCAIHKKNNSGVAFLLSASTIDLTLCNNHGHNPIHLAAGKDDEITLSTLLAKAPHLLNKPQSDGFTPLHIAALNNRLDALKVLIKRKPNIDPTNRMKMTPLHVACDEAYVDAAKLLIEGGASLSVSDADGDTALHNCLRGNRTGGNLDVLARLIGVTVRTAEEIQDRITLACFLIDQGANVTVTNDKGKSPLQCCSNDQLRNAVKTYADAHSPTHQGDGAGGLLQELFTMLRIPCVVDDCDNMANVVFKPCGHKVCCKRCCVRLEKCPICDKHIAERRGVDGQTITADQCKVQ